MEGGLQVWIRITCSLSWLMGDSFPLVWETFPAVSELVILRQAGNATLFSSLIQLRG